MAVVFSRKGTKVTPTSVSVHAQHVHQAQQEDTDLPADKPPPDKPKPIKPKPAQALTTKVDPCVLQLGKVAEFYWTLAKDYVDKPRQRPIDNTTSKDAGAKMDMATKAINIALRKMNEGNTEASIKYATDGVYYARLAWELARWL